MEEIIEGKDDALSAGLSVQSKQEFETDFDSESPTPKRKTRQTPNNAGGRKLFETSSPVFPTSFEQQQAPRTSPRSLMDMSCFPIDEAESSELAVVGHVDSPPSTAQLMKASTHITSPVKCPDFKERRNLASNKTHQPIPTHSPTKPCYDSDEEPPNSGKDFRLNWMLDPSESLSDWTIKISSNKTEEDGTKSSTSDVYHVHKTVLAFGPRRSVYFFNAFQHCSNYSESHSYNTSVELPELAAKAFTNLLDYLYFPERDLQIDTESATALHYLGQYFEMHSLRLEAKQFWQNDLSVQNCSIYFQHGRIFNDKKVIKAIVTACANNIMSITEDSQLVQVSDTELWLDILKMGASCPDSPSALANTTSDFGKDFSCHMSTLIAKYCENHQDEIDATTFHMLVGKKYLPQIRIDAAWKLIELEKHIVGRDENSKITCLEDRCIRALSVGWERIDVADLGTLDFLTKQGPVILTRLFATTLCVARDEYLQLKAKAKKNARSAEGWKKKYDQTNEELEMTKRERDQAKANVNFGSILKKRSSNKIDKKDRNNGLSNKTNFVCRSKSNPRPPRAPTISH